jgi:hypothetical protein
LLIARALRASLLIARALRASLGGGPQALPRPQLATILASSARPFDYDTRPVRTASAIWRAEMP